MKKKKKSPYISLLVPGILFLIFIFIGGCNKAVNTGPDTIIQGYVYDNEAKPVKNARVKLSYGPDSPVYDIFATADSEGLYRFETNALSESQLVWLSVGEYYPARQIEYNTGNLNTYNFGPEGCKFLPHPYEPALTPEPTKTHKEGNTPKPEPTKTHKEGNTPKPEPTKTHKEGNTPKPEPTKTHKEGNTPKPEPTKTHKEATVTPVSTTPIQTPSPAVNWEVQNSNTKVNLHDVWFIDEDRGWAVGDEGTILNTVNGGTTWNGQTTGEKNLRSICFVNDSNGWAVGSGGVIYYYDGTEWNIQNSNTSDTIYGISFSSADNGCAVAEGGALLFTLNGGADWGKNEKWSKPIYGIHLLNNNTKGWAAGSGGEVFTLTYGSGPGFELSHHTRVTTRNLYDVYFNNINLGWAVGADGTIIHTEDGSSASPAWAIQESNTVNNLNGVWFSDGSSGYAVGDNGIILHTNNGGAGWNQEGKEIKISLNSVYATEANTGYAVGDNGTILKREP